MPCIILEDLVRRHLSDGQGHAGVHEVDHLTAPDKVHKRDYYKPYQEASAADDKCILEANYISESEHGGSGIDFKEHLGLFGNSFAPRQYLGGKGLAPESECRDYEVIEASDKSADEQGLGSLSSTFSAYEHLCGGCSFRERIFPMLLLHEILSERYQEKYAEDTSQQRREEYLCEVHCELRIFVLEDEQCRKGEYGTGNDGSRAGTDGLDHHILSQGVLAAQGAGHSYCDDGYRNGCLEYLSYLESEVCCCSREYHGHYYTQSDRPWSDLRIILLGRQQRLVLLSRFQLPMCILRQLCLFFFHYIIGIRFTWVATCIIALKHKNNDKISLYLRFFENNLIKCYLYII